MASLIVTKQNNLTQTWTVSGTTGTLVLGGETAWDWSLCDLQRIEDTTTGTVFGLSAGATISNTFTAGLPTFTYTLPNLPAGTASGDTVLVYMNVTLQQLNIALLQYQKA